MNWEQENYWAAVEESLEEFRKEAAGERDTGLVKWFGGRYSGLIAAGLHLGVINVETFELLAEIRQEWEQYSMRKAA